MKKSAPPRPDLMRIERDILSHIMIGVGYGFKRPK
jgi:hypothetical protein